MRQASRQRPAKPARFLPFNPYVARFLGIMRRTARLLRPNLVILFSSVTGTTRQYAHRLAALLTDAFTVTVMDVRSFKTGPLRNAEAVVQMTSTWGAGAAPPTARAWLAYLNTAEAREALGGKPWATIGFGQKQYPRFCAAAELFLQMAAEANVRNLQPVGKCNGDGNEEADFRLWVSDLLDKYVEIGLLKGGELEELQARLLLDQANTAVRPSCPSFASFASLRLCASAPLRLCASAPLRLCASAPLPSCAFALLFARCRAPVLEASNGWGAACLSWLYECTWLYECDDAFASAKFCLLLSESRLPVQVKPPTLRVVPAADTAAAKTDVTRFTAPVKSARQLLSTSGADRATTLVTLDLARLPFLQFSPGDHLVVYPENDQKVRL